MQEKLSTTIPNLHRTNFELQPQDKISAPAPSPPLTQAPKFSDQELQLVAETTEATNNILDETINKMLYELGGDSTMKFLCSQAQQLTI